MIHIGDSFFNMLFPPRCVVCDDLLSPGEQASGIHAGCRTKLAWVKEPLCMQCGRPLSSEEQEYCFDCEKKKRQEGSFRGILQGRAVFLYQGMVRQSMYRLKYANRREYAGFFATEACKTWGDWMRFRGIEAVTAVPMYEKKKRKRGYNQAALLAEKIAELMGLPYLEHVVVRVLNTKAQKELNNRERQNNMKNAFQMERNVVQYKSVLLVDDIYTTGYTMEAVAEELYRAGIKEVYTLAICIGEGM